MRRRRWSDRHGLVPMVHVVRTADDWQSLIERVREARPATLTVQIAADGLELPDTMYAALRALVTCELVFQGVGPEASRRRLGLGMLCTDAGEPVQRFDRLHIITTRK